MRVNVETLKQLRLAQGLSIQQLAERAGVSHTVANAVETGRINPHPSTVTKLAEALGVSASTLIDWNCAGT